MKQIILNHTYQIDFETHEVRNLKHGTSSTLEPRLMQVLKMLVNNKNEVVSRKAIIEEIWGEYATGEDLLTHSICLIRNALDKSTILTVPKRGYVLVAEVSGFNRYISEFRGYFTLGRVAAALLVLIVLKMIFFPHH